MRTWSRTSPTSATATLLATLLLGCGAEETGKETAGEERPGDAGEVRLVPGERSEPRLPDANVQIVSPEPGTLVAADEVLVTLRVDGFDPGTPTPGAEGRGLAVSEQGQHVHVVLDERPYEAVYDVGSPVRFADLEPGAHLMVAFPARQWHESVKAPGASAVTWFFARDTAGGLLWDPDEPYLTYSRPKGEYRGAEADSILVDFYLHNTDLQDGHSVRVIVDDTLTFPIREWAPHYLLGLPTGQHRIRLELLGPGAAPVPASETNVTERDITVVRREAPGEREASP